MFERLYRITNSMEKSPYFKVIALRNNVLVFKYENTKYLLEENAFEFMLSKHSRNDDFIFIPKDEFPLTKMTYSLGPLVKRINQM